MVFSTVWEGLVSGGSFGLAGVLMLWLSQRTAPSLGDTAETGGVEFSVSAALLLAVLLLPWALLYCQALRGSEGHRGGLVASNSLLRLGGLYQFILPLAPFIAAPATARTRGRQTWSLEQAGTLTLLQLVWLLSFQSATLLSTVLWFEVASLLGVLLLGTSGVGVASNDGHRDRYRTLSGQRSLVTALLILLWTSGLSTVLIVWGWGISCLRVPGVDFETAGLLSAFPHNEAVARQAVGVSHVIGAGVLLKLLVQPVQFFILSFYRALPLSAFSAYLTGYYIGFVPALLGVLVAPLAALLAPWSLLVAGALCAVVGVLLGGIDHAADVRTTVAFSTVLNLSLLLLGVAA